MSTMSCNGVLVLLGLLSVLLLAACGSFFEVYVSARQVQVATPVRRKTLQEQEQARPVIKTFFERIPLEERLTGMSDEHDDALLEFWNASWYNTGWDPQIIGIEHAQLHPEYDSFVQELVAVNLDLFNRFMFVRWLAMAATGGGWMVDYDVFALRDFRNSTISNDKLTVYDSRLLPQLVSGSAESYYNISLALLETVKQHKNVFSEKQTFWTDSLGLRQVYREGTVDIDTQTGMVLERRIFQNAFLEAEECDKPRMTKGRIAVHFGMDALLEGPHVPPELRLPQHRLTMAKKWLVMYHKTCPWMI